MKKIVLLITIVIALMACSKIIEIHDSTRLVGKWEWVKSTGGIAGITETPETTGSQIIIEFTDSSCKKYLNGNLTEEMTYKLEKGKSIFSSENTLLIKYENGWTQSFDVKDNRLTLSDECYDCFLNEYSKISTVK